MDKNREVSVIIGKRSYRMQTDIDDFTLARVTSIVGEVGSAVEQGLDQEHFLMLTCLQLAYNLEKISNIIEPLQGKLERLDI